MSELILFWSRKETLFLQLFWHCFYVSSSFLLVLFFVVSFMSYVNSDPFVYTPYCQFAVYGLSFLSGSPSSQTLNRSLDLLAGYDSFELLSNTQILRDWNGFAAKREFGIVSEYLCRIEVGLRKFLSEKEIEEKVDLENFCSKKRKGEREMDLE